VRAKGRLPGVIPLIEVRGVRKAYGAVEALAGVSLTIEPGEIHALVGENGAGKSTLIRILAGAVRPDAGEIRAGGEPLPPGDAAASEAAGIATIHQESVAFPFLNAEDNLFVGREPRRAGGLLLDRRRMERDTRALLGRLGEPGIDTKRPVGELSPAARQIIAIARALSRRGRVLILDEPTASLSSAGNRRAVPHPAPAARGRFRRAVRQPPSRRGVRAGGPGDGAAGRAPRRNARRRRHRPRRADPRDGRPRPSGSRGAPRS
jgi:ABC-type branched-subunit amino acid transport system ATPase component